MDQLGPNALGAVLEPGRVADCYLGLLLPPGPAAAPLGLLINDHLDPPCAGRFERP